MDPLTTPPPSQPTPPTYSARPWQITTGILASLLLALLIVGWRYGDVTPETQPATTTPTEEPPTDPYAADPYEEWLTYTNGQSDFSFRYPPGHTVIITSEPWDEGPPPPVRAHIVATDDSGAIVPDRPPLMEVSVDYLRGVSFALWEGAPWPYFHGVISSFAFDAG